MDFQDGVSAEELKAICLCLPGRDYFGKVIGDPVLRGGFANKIKSEHVNRAQEKIMKDRL
jgi:hypothetical protein